MVPESGSPLLQYCECATSQVSDAGSSTARGQWHLARPCGLLCMCGVLESQQRLQAIVNLPSLEMHEELQGLTCESERMLLIDRNFMGSEAPASASAAEGLHPSSNC